MSGDDQRKDGFVARRAKGVGRYFSRRFGTEFTREVGHDTVVKGYRGAMDAVRPVDLDIDDFKAGYQGRYEDGGRKRFEQEMHRQGLKPADIPGLIESRRRAAQIIWAGAGVIFLFGVWGTATSDNVSHLVAGIATSLASIILAAYGLSQDFIRWQLENRRFGGFSEYFSGKRENSETTGIAIKKP